MSSEEQLLVEREGHVAIVTLNRPERLNAITGPMLDAFSRALPRLPGRGPASTHGLLGSSPESARR